MEYWDLEVEIPVHAYGMDKFGFSTDETGLDNPQKIFLNMYYIYIV